MTPPAGPSLSLKTATGLLAAAAIFGGFCVFLATAGAKGGDAAARLHAVETKQEAGEKAVADAAARAAAHEKEDAAVATTVAVHTSQIKELHDVVRSIDDKLNTIIGRLPPAPK